jgi:hypothetical protein
MHEHDTHGHSTHEVVEESSGHTHWYGGYGGIGLGGLVAVVLLVVLLVILL